MSKDRSATPNVSSGRLLLLLQHYKHLFIVHIRLCDWSAIIEILLQRYFNCGVLEVL